ncbi:MAG: protein-export chaperone SecB [Hyphomicrobiaceae bacterium]|nr:protein-export chaperone SecB [Hyphomicrobiaceae bacterium]
MAKKKKPASDGNGASQETAAPEGASGDQDADAAQFGVLVQFIKDFSFESPNAPMSLQSPGENPRLEVNVNVQVLDHSDDIYEVNLMAEAKAQSEAGVIYNVELVYAGMFRAMNIPDEYLVPVLFVDAPTILFPYLRRVVSDITRDGGFQPLMLDPIDFGALYQQSAEQAQIKEAPTVA